MGNGQCSFQEECIGEYRNVRLRELLECEEYYRQADRSYDLASFEEIFGFFLGDVEVHLKFCRDLRDPFILASLLGKVPPKRALRFVFELYANSAGVQTPDHFRKMEEATKRVVQSALGRIDEEERSFQGTFDDFWHSLQDDVGLMEFLDSIFALRREPAFLGKKEGFNEDAAKVLMMEDYETERVRPWLFVGGIDFSKKSATTEIKRCDDDVLENMRETHAVLHKNKLVTFSDVLNKTPSSSISLDAGAQPFHWLDIVATHNKLDIALTRRTKTVALLNSFDFLRLLYRMPDLFGDWWFAPVDKFVLRRPRRVPASTSLRAAADKTVIVQGPGRLEGSANAETIRKVYFSLEKKDSLQDVVENKSLSSRPNQFAAPVFQAHVQLSQAVSKTLQGDPDLARAIDRFHIFSSDEETEGPSSHVADLMFLDLARFVLDRHAS